MESKEYHFAIAGAKQWLIRKLPALGWFIETLPCVVTKSCPGVAASKNGVVYVHPIVIDEHVAILPFLLMREMAQILLNHSKRRAFSGIPPTVWTPAARMAIYCLLGSACMLPARTKAEQIGLLDPSDFNMPTGCNAEHYADLIMSNSLSFDFAGPGENDKSEGTDTGEKESGSAGSSKNADAEDDQDGGTAEIDLKAGGSAEDGLRRPWETQEDRARPAFCMQLSIEEAQQAMRGAIGAGFDRLLGQYAGKVEGASKLLQLIKPDVEFGRGQTQEYNYSKIARRSQLGYGYAVGRPRALLPRMDTRSYKAAILIDTSGSMSEEQELAKVAKLVWAMASLRAGLFHVFVGDTEVKASTVLRTAKEKLKFKGGGGTSLDQIINQVLQTIPERPIQLIIFTDGWTPWPAQRPSGVFAKVVLTKDPSSYYPVPDWMETYKLEEFIA